MKKIMMLLVMFVIMSSAALADWGASRSISGNIVTITITPGDGFDTFTVTETLTGATVVAPAPRGCGISGNKLICDFDGVDPGTIIYTTSGSGSVAGSIDGVNSLNLAVAGQTKTITGATAIPTVAACIPESDSAFCSRLGKNCGQVIGNDNCGVSRTVSSCGTCTSPATCGGAGVANVCGQAPPAAADSVGTQVDNLLTSRGLNPTAPVRGSWTASLVSSLANLFRNLFG